MYKRQSLILFVKIPCCTSDYRNIICDGAQRNESGSAFQDFEIFTKLFSKSILLIFSSISYDAYVMFIHILVLFRCQNSCLLYEYFYYFYHLDIGISTESPNFNLPISQKARLQ